MQKNLKELSFIPYLLVLGLILLFYLTLLFYEKKPEAIYGDAGISYLQTRNFIESGYSTFAYNYRAGSFDTEHRLIPFQKPWIAKVGNREYLQYPPWFILTVLPFYLLAGNTGFYLFNFLAFLLSFFVIWRFLRILNAGTMAHVLSLILFAFGTTAPLYTLYFHENTFAWLLSAMSVFYAYRAITNDSKKLDPFLFGLFAGLAVVYRLDLIVVLFPVGISLVFFDKKLHWKYTFGAALGFFIPISLFLIGNMVIHGHPLSLRYLNNVAESEIKSLSDRFDVIGNLLFGHDRGLFYQSPWLAIALVASLHPVVHKNKKITLLLMWFVISSLLMFAFTPNQGSHFAPRYLFGLLVPVIIYSGVLTEDLIQYIIFHSGQINHLPEQNVLNQTSSERIKIFSGIALLFFLSIGLLFSFKRFSEKLIWILKSDSFILKANKSISSVPSHVFVFTEYASPQNVQYSFSDKKIVLVKSKEDFLYLMDSLKRNNISSYLVAFPLLKTSIEITNSDSHQGSTDTTLLEKLQGYPSEIIPDKPEKFYIRYPYILVEYKVKD